MRYKLKLNSRKSNSPMLIQINEINLILVVCNRTRNIKILLKININVESIISLNLFLPRLLTENVLRIRELMTPPSKVMNGSLWNSRVDGFQVAYFYFVSRRSICILWVAYVTKSHFLLTKRIRVSSLTWILNKCVLVPSLNDNRILSSDDIESRKPNRERIDVI